MTTRAGWVLRKIEEDGRATKIRLLHAARRLAMQNLLVELKVGGCLRRVGPEVGGKVQALTVSV